MSNYLTSRKQFTIGDERQIFSPVGLEEGMPIGLVDAWNPASYSQRAWQAFGSLIIGGEEGNRFQAAKSGWQSKGLEGVLPRWIGNVLWTNTERASVKVTRAIGDWDLPQDFIGRDPLELPELEEPYTIFPLFSELGLTAIRPVVMSHSLEGDATPDDIGRWKRHATLDLR